MEILPLALTNNVKVKIFDLFCFLFFRNLRKFMDLKALPEKRRSLYRRITQERTKLQNKIPSGRKVSEAEREKKCDPAKLGLG
jgi:hypothetical protein